MDTQQHTQIIGMVYRNHHVVSHWVLIDGLRVATVKKEVQLAQFWHLFKMPKQIGISEFTLW